MSMTSERAFEIFREAGTLREGHFVLTSGRHSDRFFLMPHTFQFPAFTEELCAALAAEFDGVEIDTVVGPATGGVILAYEMARQLGLRRGGKGPRAIFAEKTEDGGMALKRQWTIAPGEKVLMVEDAITTGGSVFRVIEAISQFQPQIVGVACIADRSGGKVVFPAPLRSLVTLQVDAWLPHECPLCKQGSVAVKPKA